MEQQRKLIVYIACSVDGFIAAPGDDLSFLNPMEKDGEDYGYGAFIAGVDTVIMGRRTYDWVIKAAGGYQEKNKPVYIITRTERPQEGNVHFYTDDPATLIETLREKEGKNIFLDGGAELIHYFMQKKLIDEWIISVIPVMLGDGVRLFQPPFPLHDLLFVSSKSFDTGLVQLHYKTKQ